MFGYLVADTKTLTEEQFKRYKACYCGLCRSLQQRHGQLARLTLNYDVTFLVLLLGSLYEPEETAGESTCPRHPRTAQLYAQSQVSDYAADMNVALAYLNCLDDWQDDANVGALLQAKLLKDSYEKVEQQYPRQISAIEQELRNLSEIEKQNLEAPDAAAACFGRLMAELFVYRDDRWAAELRYTGHALGRFIYLMDACMDLDRDTIRNSYNPFRRYYGLDNQQRFTDMLKMQLGDCVWHFDKLPLVQDVGLMKNILCTGIWSKFNSKFSKRKES